MMFLRTLRLPRSPIMKSHRHVLFLGALLTVLAPAPAELAAQALEQVLSTVEYREIGPTRQSGRFVDIAVPQQQPHTFYIATASGHLWKTTNRGISFEVLFDQEEVFSIGAIAVVPSDPNVLYLGSGEANNSRSSYWGDGVYRSTDAGETWTNIGLPESHDHIGRIVVHPTDPYYYGQIIIDPNDSDVVHVMSASSFGTSDGGETWDRRPLGFGGDDHALWINPDDSNHMILGYDHGLGITYDGGENWYHPDFQSLAQFYAIGIDDSHPYRVAGGIQDNGSAMGYSTNPAGGPIRFEMWNRVGGGDGMYNEFDRCTNRYLYNESQFGALTRLDLWTGESKRIRYEDADMRYNWNAPIVVSEHDCDVIYHAGNKVMKSEFRGESWQVISEDLSKNDPATLTTGKGGDGNIQYGTITTLDESPIKAGLLWAGTDDGNVQVTQNDGETWTDVTDNIPNNPHYWVSRVEASHHDLGTAYATFTGYRNDDFRPFIYKTTNFGESWSDISNNLPDGPINVVREHHDNPDLLFVGTEFQVFASIDGGESWAGMKGDMPTVPVHDMKIHPRANDLVVGTHGRGIYIADLAPLSEMTEGLLAMDAHFFQPESKVRWIAPDFTNYGSSNFEGESEAAEIPLYYYLSEDVDEDITFTVYQGQFPIYEIEGEGEAGLHHVAWNMQKRLERTAEEQAGARSGGGRGGRGGGFGGRGRGNTGISAEDRARFAFSEAPIGEYRVVMTVGAQTFEHTVSILKDEWWQERR